jgi:hypothetical protein
VIPLNPVKALFREPARGDFGIERSLGPKSWTMEMEFGIEGVRK